MTTTTPTTAPLPNAIDARPRRLAALARAEYLQFRRNKTLVFMGTVFPVAIPLATFFVGRPNADDEALLMATSLEIFAFQALLFVQYYSVLSLITTRRSEGVLKRLRTGEAADWQIKTAPAVSGVVLTFVGAAIVAAAIYGAGAPAPVNPVAMLLALAGGLIVFTFLALLTSAVTRNAEAAQITSIPVIVMATVGLGSLRNTLPDRLAELAEWTPFAAISDLIHLGANGKLSTTGDTAPTLDLADTFAELGRPAATLGAWTIVAFVLATKYFRWDDRG